MAVYTPVTITGYNTSPPPDDGSTGTNNQLTWAKHKDKLGDPIKTAVESINTNVASAINTSMKPILGVGHATRSGYTDVRTTSYSDTGQSITYTKTDAGSTLYVEAAFNCKAWTSFAALNYQHGKCRLVYATDTTTGISPTTDLVCAYIKENGMDIPSGTVQLGFGYSAIWKVTGLAAAAYTFKVQGKCANASDGGAEFVDGTMRVLEVLE
tara:strand:- start:579 stop:1211 length:633 start_codon:yes stop_codon:yes gene_type:complete